MLDVRTSGGPRTLKLGSDFRVDPTPSLRAELARILGPEALAAPPAPPRPEGPPAAGAGEAIRRGTDRRSPIAIRGRPTRCSRAAAADLACEARSPTALPTGPPGAVFAPWPDGHGVAGLLASEPISARRALRSTGSGRSPPPSASRRGSAPLRRRRRPGLARSTGAGARDPGAVRRRCGGRRAGGLGVRIRYVGRPVRFGDAARRGAERPGHDGPADDRVDRARSAARQHRGRAGRRAARRLRRLRLRGDLASASTWRRSTRPGCSAVRSSARSRVRPRPPRSSGRSPRSRPPARCRCCAPPWPRARGWTRAARGTTRPRDGRDWRRSA